MAPKAAAVEDFGIVVNQTFTTSAQEFYRRFTDFWRERPDFEDYTLIITERPSLRDGNRITIIYEQQSVFTGNLPVKYDAVKALAADASEKVYANILSGRLSSAGRGDPDMAKSGF